MLDTLLRLPPGVIAKGNRQGHLRNAPPARQSPYSPAERLPQPLQSKLIKPAAATKSP